jgi:glycosyltransferase involved in cell wall biosynthesis
LSPIKNYAGRFDRLKTRIFSIRPFDVLQIDTGRIKGQITKLLETNQYDLLFIEGYQMAHLAKGLNIPIKVLDKDCAHASILTQLKYSPNIRSFIGRLVELYKVRRYEKNKNKQFDRIIFCSLEDKEIWSKVQLSDKTEVIPTGVDNLNYSQVDALKPSDNRLVFTGTMGYHPNIDAVKYFCSEIFPLIRKEIKNAEFYIVGQNPTAEVKALEKLGGITVTGWVKNINPYILESSVYVCPVRIGVGIKTKILESMALGVPVVTTTNNNRAIGAVEGRDIIVADKPDSFAKAVINLMRDEAYRKYIGQNGKALIREKYSWPIIQNKFNNFFTNILQSGRKP